MIKREWFKFGNNILITNIINIYALVGNGSPLGYTAGGWWVVLPISSMVNIYYREPGEKIMKRLLKLEQ